MGTQYMRQNESEEWVLRMDLAVTFTGKPYMKLHLTVLKSCAVYCTVQINSTTPKSKIYIHINESNILINYHLAMPGAK